MNVEGAEDVIEFFEKIPPTHIKKTIQKYGSLLQKKAQQKAPVDTGFLKQHIQPPKIENNGYSAEVISSAEYSIHLEYGTRFMSAKPFMRPALNEIEKSFLEELKAWK